MTHPIITALEQAIAQAQALLKCYTDVTSEGWSKFQPNGSEPEKRFAPRHGCYWNEQEKSDLLRSFLNGRPTITIAGEHRRTEGSVRSELGRLVSGTTVERLIKQILAEDK